MYALIRSVPLRKLFAEQAPVLCGSMLIAEIAYKFHSFTLECAAFLATWYVLDATRASIWQRLAKPITTDLN